ncbi:hypothetical protein AJ80_03436 [Polytolypa hystricis UAMH7299]|uniref:Zn(2)-C6 fungal-type domain-containing protein n=1 Tax=Polytolypa hystricis (strain UAMH7299) TaxID=1447883 RepID=A0A2B7YI71_POLH7|nr:hypothetical protein AJ80_03436 [Polytolypa hystricis UAMH7299]
MDYSKASKLAQAAAASNNLPPCHNCRKRRVHCDATRPACNKCAVKGIECLGYGKHKPLVWLQDGGNQNQYLADAGKGASSEQKKRKKGRPKLLVAKDVKEGVGRTSVMETGNGSQRTESTSTTLGMRGQSTVPDLVERLCKTDVQTMIDATKSLMKMNSSNTFVNNHMPETLDLKYPTDVKLIVKGIQFFNQKVYPDIAPITHYRTLTYIYPKNWQSDISNLLWHILASVAATTVAVQTQQQDHVVFGQEIYQYRSDTFRRLNRELTRPESQLGDLTLLCILTLLLAEPQQSAVGAWWAHFEGARKIIELRGGLAAVCRQNPIFKPTLAYFIISDVMSATTAHPLSIEDASRPLEYCQLLSEVYRDGTDTCVPCPNELFECIIQINYLRSLSCEGICDNETSFDMKEAVRSLILRILSFSILEWANGMNSRYAETTPGIVEVVPGFINATTSDWIQIAGMYRSAVLLYCIRSLALDFDGLLLAPGIEGPTLLLVEDVQDSARETIFDSLDSIFASPNTRILGKVAIWPIFVAGIEAGQADGASGLRGLVSSALKMLSRSLGTLSLRDARNFLENEWRKQDESTMPSGLRWWNEIFEHAHGRYSFFM